MRSHLLRHVLLLALAAALLPAATADAQTRRGGDKEEADLMDLINKASRGSTRVRGEAITSLAGRDKETIKEHSIVDMLLGFAADGGESVFVRVVAIEGASKIASATDKSYRNELVRVLRPMIDNKGEPQMVRHTIIKEAPQYVERGSINASQMMSSLGRVINDQLEEPFLIGIALRTVGYLGGPTEYKIIRDKLSSSKEQISAMAFEALLLWLQYNDLPRNGDPSLVRILLEYVRDADRPAEKRITAMRILAQLESSSAVKELESIVKTVKIKSLDDEALLIEAIKTLGSIGDNGSVAPLIKCFRDFPGKEDVRIRTAVMDAMANFVTRFGGGERPNVRYVMPITDFVVEALKKEGEDTQVLSAAIFAALEHSINKRLNRRVLVPALIELLEHDQLSEDAERALTFLTDHSVFKPQGMTKEQLKKKWEEWWKGNQSRFR
jgi:hypothetical protein